MVTFAVFKLTQFAFTLTLCSIQVLLTMSRNSRVATEFIPEGSFRKQATTPRMRRCSLPSVSLDADLIGAMELVPYSLYIIYHCSRSHDILCTTILITVHVLFPSGCHHVDLIPLLKPVLSPNFDPENTNQTMLISKQMH